MLLVAAALIPAEAQRYTFRRFAEPSGEVVLLNPPSLNDAGVVAVTAILKNEHSVVFPSSRDALQKIAETVESFRQTRHGGYAVINNAGLSAFGLLERDGSSLLTYRNGETRTIAAVKDQLTSLGMNEVLALDNQGRIAFPGLAKSGNGILFETSGETLRTLAQRSDLRGLQSTIRHVATASGQPVTIVEDLGFAVGGRLLSSTGSGVTQLASDSEHGPATGYQAVDMNAKGDIVYSTSQLFGQRGGVCVCSGGERRQIAQDRTGPLGNPTLWMFDDVCINDSGTVAYLAGMENGNGIFTGPDPARDRVIGTGDALFGSTVEEIAGSMTGGTRFLNNSGQIAFTYRLRSGEVGVAIATPAAAAPVLQSSSIVNAASFRAAGSPADAIGHGAIISLFGTNLGSALAVAGGSPLPTALQGTSVLLNGNALPLYFVSPTQINAQLPYLMNAAPYTIQVRTAGGSSAAVPLLAPGFSPGIYSLSQSGSGEGAIVHAATGEAAGPGQRPAKPGDIVTIQANGLGAVTPEVKPGFNSCDPDGRCNADLSNAVIRFLTTKPAVEIGGRQLADSDVLFAGLAPQFVGLYQLNVRIPADAPAGGSVSVVIKMGSHASRNDVTMAISR